MSPSRSAVLRLLAGCLLLIEASGDMHYYLKARVPNPRLSKTRQEANAGFDPEILNRFLEEYANKIKRTTTTTTAEPMANDRLDTLSSVEIDSDADMSTSKIEAVSINETAKRNKYYSANSPASDDRSKGWVTLEAIPWSKSKISKWQASPTTQGPWPSDSHASFNKWNPEYVPRPSPYEGSKPWQNRPPWAETPASSKPNWYQDRPRPSPSRPSYGSIDKYEESVSQAQKWPPEKPSWDRYETELRPLPIDIITDNGPSNFPIGNINNWDQRPTYTHHTESYVNDHGWSDRNDFPPSKYQHGKPDDYYDRPHFSVYKYPSIGNSQHHQQQQMYLQQQRPHSYVHPSMGEGQWVLLSTNRGYTTKRQRSMKLDSLLNPTKSSKKTDNSHSHTNDETSSESQERPIPSMISKRQVNLNLQNTSEASQ